MSQLSSERKEQASDRTIHMRRNGLTVDCSFAANGKLQGKVERQGNSSRAFAYQFDEKGHLVRVSANGVLEEEYHYNAKGQRIRQTRHYERYSDSNGGALAYDAQGRLLQAEETTYVYDANGSLAERRDRNGVTRFVYNGDTMLDMVILPSQEEIRYQYDTRYPSAPARRFKNKELVTEYTWLTATRLANYRDYEHQVAYAFTYNDSACVHSVRITPIREVGQVQDRYVSDFAARSSNWLSVMTAQKRQGRLRALFPEGKKSLELLCGCDQVGTLTLLTDTNGALVKEIRRDSFGVIRSDSLPDLFMPIGFAGGLAEPDTGLTRFGYRDYDPFCGRFISLDPARDRRGDGDLYDYCVDDPVGRGDSNGLNFAQALYTIGPVAISAMQQSLATLPANKWLDPRTYKKKIEDAHTQAEKDYSEYDGIRGKEDQPRDAQGRFTFKD